ncbi:MAG: cell division protein ZapA [Gemmatimonadetes bacterium]|nr:cell division protein ZapA [Gemmatimonadota bacterium]
MSEPVSVRILGEEYTIRSEAPAEYTRGVAEFFDRAVADTQREAGIVEPQKLLILAALSVTDQLFRARESEEQLRRALDRRAGALASEVTAALEARSA